MNILLNIPTAAKVMQEATFQNTLRFLSLGSTQSMLYSLFTTILASVTFSCRSGAVALSWHCGCGRYLIFIFSFSVRRVPRVTDTNRCRGVPVNARLTNASNGFSSIRSNLFNGKLAVGVGHVMKTKRKNQIHEGRTTERARFVRRGDVLFIYK